MAHFPLFDFNFDRFLFFPALQFGVKCTNVNNNANGNTNTSRHATRNWSIASPYKRKLFVVFLSNADKLCRPFHSYFTCQQSI